MSRTLRIALAVLILAAVGFFIPQYMDNGVAKFRDDPTQYRVAVAGLQAYWTLNRHPVARLLTPGARVRRVWVDPGHCHDPRSNDPSGDYRAEVQGLSWFGIAGPVIDVTCGGWGWSRRM